MANVQKENGFIPIARDLLRALVRARLPMRHHSVMLAIMDKTYGWKKKADRISASQIAEFTGIRHPHHIRSALADLERWGMIYRSPANGRQIRTVGIVKNFDLWLIPPPAKRSHRSTPRGTLDPNQGYPPRYGTVPPVVPRVVPPVVPTEAKHSLKALLPTEVGANAPHDPLELVPREISERLVNLLAKKPGTREAKVDWLDQNIDLMIAELEDEGVRDPLQNFGALKRRIFRWYNQHLKHPDGKGVVESFEERRVRKIREWAHGDNP